MLGVVKKLIFIWLAVFFNVTVAAAQKMTIAPSKQLPKLVMVEFSTERFPKIDRHPTEVFREQFIISWIIGDWWKSVFEKLNTQDKSRLLAWMNKESKKIYTQRETVWRQLEKQSNPGFIKWLIGELSNVLVNSFVHVQYEDLTTAKIAVPIIDYYQCQIADLMCLEYLCRYKAVKDSFVYNPDWFKVLEKPIPPDILSIVEITLGPKRDQIVKDKK